MKYKSNLDMAYKSILVAELIHLKPLIGKWDVKGSFKDKPDKSVDGWETYEVIDEGNAILCEGETQTILTGNIIDIYKYAMRILYNKDVEKVIGDKEWEIGFDENMLTFQNNRHRYTGKLNESNGTIAGKWENLTASGDWKYWYDKVFTSIKDNT